MFGRMDIMVPAQRLRSEVERLFDSITHDVGFRTPFGFPMVRGLPALNLWEDEHNLYAEAEVPGLTMKELEIFVVGNELTLRGSRKTEEQSEGLTYHRRERSASTFSRVIRLPVDIAADKVSAELRDGVLTVKLPKAEAAKPRKIEVRAQ